MKWLRTLALLSSLLCVWQLTEGRPPAIPPRHLFNNVQSHGGSSFIDKAKIMYSQRHLQNRILHKENPPPRQFSNIVNQRRFKTNPKLQFDMQKQSPRALPLISSLRHSQQHAIIQNAPTFGDAIKGLMSGSIEGHINSDLQNKFPGTTSTTTSVPIVDIAMDFKHPVASPSGNNQDSSSPIADNNSDSIFSNRNINTEPNPTNEINNNRNTNSQSQNQDNLASTNQESTIILASLDYPDYSGTSDIVTNRPTSVQPPSILPETFESGFPELDYPPDFPDYSNVDATSPEVPALSFPDSGFPEPNYPPGFPDYSDSITTNSNNPLGQGSNDFNLPDSGFPEPNYPPDFPDYSSSVDSGVGFTKSIASSPDSNSNSPDYNAPSSDQTLDDFINNYGPFPDYNSPDSSATNSNSQSGQGSNDFGIPDSGFPEPNFPPDFPDYSSSVDSGVGFTKSIPSSPDSNSNSPDYNAPSAEQTLDEFINNFSPSSDYNSPSPDYNAPSPDYNAPPQDYNTGDQNFGAQDYSSPDYAQTDDSVGMIDSESQNQTQARENIVNAFLEQFGKFMGTTIQRTVEVTGRQAHNTRDFLRDTHDTIMPPLMEVGTSAQELFTTSLDAGRELAIAIGEVVKQFTANAFRTITGEDL